MTSDADKERNIAEKERNMDEIDNHMPKPVVKPDENYIKASKLSEVGSTKKWYIILIFVIIFATAALSLGPWLSNLKQDTSIQKQDTTIDQNKILADLVKQSLGNQEQLKQNQYFLAQIAKNTTEQNQKIIDIVSNVEGNVLSNLTKHRDVSNYSHNVINKGVEENNRLLVQLINQTRNASNP